MSTEEISCELGLEGYADEFFFLDKLFPCLLFLVKLFLHVTNQLYFCLLKFHKFVTYQKKKSSTNLLVFQTSSLDCIA
jgi:hypothetical protein